jgi:hypothetical protein
MTTKSKATTHHASSTTSESEAAPKSTTSNPLSQQSSALVTTTGNGKQHSTKVDLQAQYQSLIAGLLKYYKSTDTFQLAQGVFTRDEIIALVQKFIAACQGTQEANQEWRAAIQAERTLELGMRTLRKGVRGIVLARFGTDGPPILKFGFTLPKVQPKTTETKAIAAAKGQATRVARGTMSKAEKKKIKGNVNVALVVTPAGAGQASAATAATATSATGANAAQAQVAPVNTELAAAPPVTTTAGSGPGTAGH